MDFILDRPWLVIILLIGLAFLTGYCSYQDEKQFKAEMEHLRKMCIADGESKWTCEAVIEAKRSKRASDKAAAAAGVAAGVAASSAAGRR